MTTTSEPASGADAPFLSVRDLRVRFRTEDGVVKAVDGLSFDVERGRTLGIVGESGSGKSVANQAILGLHNPAAATVTGEILLEGENLVGARERRLERLRGNRIAMIFQDPLTALSPYHTVGFQIAEPYRKHRGASRREARERAVEMLAKVGIPHPSRRVDDYPHQFSGGMRQRAMIAMALSCDPDLLIADEPTTALDVTVQAQILDLLAELQDEFGSAIIMITHDLGVVSRVSDDVLVMYAGRAVERGSVHDVLSRPQHPYTWGLLSSMPRLHGDVGQELVPIAGTPPSLLNPPPGCPFQPRCPYDDLVPDGTDCSADRPALPAGRGAACHLAPERKHALFTERIRPRLVPGGAARAADETDHATPGDAI
ncbi:ABC transporter ATP-binding protein [Streptomyces sp. RFCAC02]|uniref:ABC transporter ATP-binding protein n=1 Tax=Streptomyces sp. RFCAC02 TaxID=2499143 RepID=UPI0010225CB5|nr:ABC transporter ATP-binding protein [Streptomyces sp. RFCAC02]